MTSPRKVGDSRSEAMWGPLQQIPPGWLGIMCISIWHLYFSYPVFFYTHVSYIFFLLYIYINIYNIYIYIYTYLNIHIFLCLNNMLPPTENLHGNCLANSGDCLPDAIPRDLWIQIALSNDVPMCKWLFKH